MNHGKPDTSVLMKLLADTIDWKTVPKEWLKDPCIQEIKKFTEMNNDER